MAKTSKFLQRPTVPIAVTDKSVSELMDAMASTGFQGRKLGESIDTWAHMLKDNKLTIFMGLTGAMCPAGQRKIVAYFIQNRMIDCLVSTGANMFHDIHESLGGHHYVGTHAADDEALFKEGVDRIYDVFAVEEQFRNTDRLIADFSKTLEPNKPYSSREFMFLLGKWLFEKGADHDSVVVSAYMHNVPIFVPALCDSSIGIGLMVARRGGRVIMPWLSPPCWPLSLPQCWYRWWCTARCAAWPRLRLRRPPRQPFLRRPPRWRQGSIPAWST